jgi:hypothetical protein
MEMWTTLRFAPTCPHSHSPDYDFSPLHRQPEGFPNCKKANRDEDTDLTISHQKKTV